MEGVIHDIDLSKHDKVGVMPPCTTSFLTEILCKIIFMLSTFKVMLFKKTNCVIMLYSILEKNNENQTNTNYNIGDC